MKRAGDQGITVVIPTYNAAPFLRRSVGSVLGQTRPPIEILIVDDGSTDDTVKIAAEFGDRVRCIQTEHSGVSETRNRGIREARGSYVAFLDADDEWLPEHLEQAWGALRDHPEVKWYAGAYQQRTHDGVLLHMAPERRLLVDGSYFLDYFETLSSWCNATPGMVIHRDVFDEVGMFDPEMSVGEDLDLWFRIGMRFPRIAYRPGIRVVVWSVEGSLMTRASKLPGYQLGFLIRCSQRAAEIGPDAVRRVRPFIVRWAVDALRTAALTGDTQTLETLARSYREEIPLAWRGISACARFLPEPVWSLTMRGWAAVRAIRLASLRRRETRLGSGS